MDSDSKHVVCMHMPQIKGIAPHRKEAMAEHGACHISLPRRPKTERFTTELYLSNEIEAIGSLFPKYLVVFTGAVPHLSARQEPSELDSPSSSLLFAPNSTILQEGGILKRYQILTPALITSLLITFFVLVPIIMLGVQALASIQSPLSSEVPKGFDAQEKKTQ